MTLQEYKSGSPRRPVIPRASRDKALFEFLREALSHFFLLDLLLDSCNFKTLGVASKRPSSAHCCERRRSIMMLSVATKALLFSSVLSGAAVVVAQDCGPAWVCPFTSSPPTLDADLSEWADVVSYSTTLVMIDGTQYEAGNAVYKCMHDENNIYFALEIPGDYRFNSTNNEQCAAIATMMKIGAQATFLNMGGCPDALTGCTQGAIPTTCDAHRVDIGAHWELATTERGVSYPIDTTSGTGDDPVANKDDEYVSE